MTWTVTSRGSDFVNGSGTQTLVSDTFTPAADSLLIAFTIGGDFDTPGITGHDGGASWAKIFDGFAIAASGDPIQLWAAITGSSPTSGTITVGSAYQFNTHVVFVEFNETSGFPAAVADCFGTGVRDYVDSVAAPTTLTANVSAFGQSTNLALACAYLKVTYTGSQFTPDTGYTELAEYAATSNYSLAVAYKDSEDTSITNICDESWSQNGILGIEVKHAAAAPAGDNTIIIVPTGPALS